MIEPAPPITRESSNVQDAAGTTAEMAVQPRPSRSTLKSIVIEPVPIAIARLVIEQHHYLHSIPAGVRACFGVYLWGELVGACVLTSGPFRARSLLSAGRFSDVITLSRLWLSDALPRNAESRVLGVVLRALRRRGVAKLVLTYADEAVGHIGTIYQATGWLYLGVTEPDQYIRLEDGRLHHPRTVASRYGSNRVRHLQATGIHAAPVAVAGKHRYVYVLDPAWRWRLCKRPQPFPKSSARAPP